MLKKTSPIPPIAGCLVIQLCVGILYIWSVLRGEFAASFALPPESALPTMVASYNLFAFVLGNLAGGLLNDRKGAKVTAITGVVMFSLGVGLTALLTKATAGLIVLTYCVVGGLGSGIAYGACISCVQKWLPHRRGFASGLAVSAFGLSTVVFAPVARALMTAFTDGAGVVSFGGVFGVLAGVFFAFGIASCALVKAPPKEYLDALPRPANTRVVSSARDLTLSEAMKTVPFWCIFLYIFFINGTWNLTSPLIAELGEDARGLTQAQAVFAVSFAAVPNCAGRLIMAAMSDRIGRVAASIILCGITFAGAVFMTFAAGVPYIVTVAVIAFGYGGPSAINAAVTTDLFGVKNSGANYGIVMTGLGVSSVVFNLISQKLLRGDAARSFIMGAGTAILAAATMLVINVYLKRLSRRGGAAPADRTRP
ncbi:MAG: MFS transporter [Oscillospiraceae bacterium]|nr:MFS transporter [Oscillospiraceae bacterium]